MSLSCQEVQNKRIARIAQISVWHDDFHKDY